jgi:beta-mannosidase
MPTIELSGLEWTLVGWRPFTWKLAKNVEAGWRMPFDLGPYPASVPGTVQRALFEAGVIPDWSVGLNSRDCEWVEHRHWDFTTVLSPGLIPEGEQVILDAQGLDYSGWILVDCVKVAQFEGALLPHRFDLTDPLSDGKAHQLSIIFNEAPQEQGQIGYTSLSRFFKPRYNYSWDWTPRLVPVGVTDALTIRTGVSAAYSLDRITASLAEDNRTGTLRVVVRNDFPIDEPLQLVVMLRDADHVVGKASVPLGGGAASVGLGKLNVVAWWPNGHGDQKLYEASVQAVTHDGETLWSETLSVGFKRVEWLPSAGARKDAEPWICSVNGKPVFLQGVNWVPPRTLYPDATEEEYRRLIGLYKDMGCTIVRVWGGAILERRVFYDLCDRAGILVWQEFPLSSSGVENCPPDGPRAIEGLKQIAASHIRRRARHVSLLLWCGGNELTWGGSGEKQGIKPVDYSHPCIAALRDVVQQEDPGRRFIPTSSSGPKFSGDAADFGKGLHHDVHGPWGMGGFADIEAWRQYWAGDDALFRSEVGMPGAADADLILRYAGKGPVWPPLGEYWMHTAAWWSQWDRYEKDLGDLGAEEGLRAYVERTQRHQAEAYAIAARACKDRFPRCGGFIIWMGHDCFPCPANNSVIDFDRNPKPAYYALKDVFRS